MACPVTKAVRLLSTFAAGALILKYLKDKFACAQASESKPADDQTQRSTTSSSGGGPSAYETQKAVDEYLQFHFGEGEDQMPYSFGPKEALQFTARIAKLGEPHVSRAAGNKIRALDVGCAVGGASFELAKWCDEVIGVDFSASFVRAAEVMRLSGELTYNIVEEGELTSPRLAKRPDVDITRVSFQEGDACNLSEALGQFDVVLAANLLCRLPEPSAFLNRLKSLVRPGGVVVLVSPYSWLPGWTKKANWLGGYYAPDGSARRSSVGLTSLLSTDFTLVHEENVPFLIREHARKFQYGVSQALVWRRNQGIAHESPLFIGTCQDIENNISGQICLDTSIAS